MARRDGWTKVPNWLMYNQRVTIHALVVFAALNSFADQDGICWPSHRAVAQRAHCSVTTVKKAINELVAYGVVVVEHRTVNGEPTANRYTLSLDPPAFAYEDDAARFGGEVSHRATDPRRQAPDAGPEVATNKIHIIKTANEQHSHRPSTGGLGATTSRSHEPSPAIIEKEFANRYEGYPRKGQEPASYRAFRRARSRGVSCETLTMGLANQLETFADFEEEYIPFAHNWLLGERWADEDLPPGRS